MSVWDSVNGFFKDVYSDASKVAGDKIQQYVNKFEDYKKGAESYGAMLGLDFTPGNAHNNDADAFRHAFASAKATIDYGASASAAAGVLREKFETKFGKHKQPENEAVMDNYNNKMGRTLGRMAVEEGWNDATLAQKVKEMLDNNKLITRPTAKPASILDYYNSY